MHSRWIHISIAAQQLELMDASGGLRRYPVSTSRRGAGERAESGCTPRGEHEIRSMIGAGKPLGAVFVGRRPTGEVCNPERLAAEPERDWMLTRVLWLRGREVGRNRLGEVDTMRRFIYIHGTPHVAELGTPASHGCIRMRNEDVVDLFDRVALRMRVVIDP
jgi:L,D-transpeptidase YbiS